MKKVEKVSIADISFTLDSDAYAALEQYLDSLHRYYENDPDGREIIADIEARIAELILGEQVYTKVVSRPLIDTIITQLGTPDQIDDEAGEGSPGTSTWRGAGAAADSQIPRRLHRRAEGKIFGGVCGGFATFLDTNVAWVRLIFLAPLLLCILIAPFHRHRFEEFCEGWIWVFFVTYIVLWIALPMARTPRQKLEARGERITPASIRQTMQGAASTPAGRKAASVAAELLTVVGRVVLFFVKFVMAVIGFSVLFTAAALVVAMLAALFDPATMTVADDIAIFSLLDGMRTPVLFVLLVLFCVMMPLLVVGMAMLSFTFGWRLGRLFYGLTLGSWGLAIILCGFLSIGEARFFRDVLPGRIERLEHHGRHRHWEYDPDGEEWRATPGRVTIREIPDSLGVSGPATGSEE
ncbi:MAG: PspC domain-containing protein [Alistipes sp.]|jgi:phage shock protein PspC (stress-responsive transcriptional regulator)|nr:PspC domain-containing protein [Alistipes sp.]